MPSKKSQAETTVGVQFTSLHHMDHSTDQVISIDIDSKSKDLGDYIERLIEDIRDKNSKRSFQFASQTTEVRSAISMFSSENYDQASEINAKRLLNVEKETQRSVDKMQIVIQKGSLFQSVINNEDGTKMVVIVKADHNDFLDATDFIVHKGLPWKKRVFKSFLAIIDNSGAVIEILVSDTTNTLMKYWWSEFLELEELRTDAHNTKFFLEFLDKKLLNKLKTKYPADHIVIRNSVLGYFRSQKEFKMDTFYSSIFENYTPIKKKFPIDELRNNVKDIPQKYNLDSQFNIDRSEIKKKLISKIELSEGLELVINDYTNLDNISTFKDEEDNKYIAIKSDVGYRKFNKGK